MASIDNGFFEREIVPVTLPDGTVVTTDDGPRRGTTLEGLAQLKPAFRPDGEITAGNACPLNDGAAAVVVMSDTKAAALGIKPLARVVSSGVSALDPEIMGLGPIEASRQALGRAGLTIDDIDLVEINEAFAAQVLPSAKHLGIPIEKLNVHGGAIALGHPFGMTGARIMATLLNGLEHTGGRYGLETMCVGGGQGMAMIVERLSSAEPSRPARSPGQPGRLVKVRDHRRPPWRLLRHVRHPRRRPPSSRAASSHRPTSAPPSATAGGSSRRTSGPLILITLAVVVGPGRLPGAQLPRRSAAATAASARIFLSLVFGGLGALVGFILQYGVVRAALAVVDGRPVSFAEAWNMDRFGPFVIAAILQGLIMFVGYLLCIIPGIIAAFLLFFTPFFVIDRQMRPTDALAASFNLVKNNAGILVLFTIVAVVVYFAGAIVCLVGLLVSIPSS